MYFVLVWWLLYLLVWWLLVVGGPCSPLWLSQNSSEPKQHLMLRVALLFVSKCWNTLALTTSDHTKIVGDAIWDCQSGLRRSDLSKFLTVLNRNLDLDTSVIR